MDYRDLASAFNRTHRSHPIAFPGPYASPCTQGHFAIAERIMNQQDGPTTMIIPPNLDKVTINAAPPSPPAPTGSQTGAQADPRFLCPLIIEELPDGRNFSVYSEFDYHTDIDHLVCIHIPPGFLTDFASIPRLFWNILPPNGVYGKAAVVHDYCYRTKGFCTKAEADHIFLEAMQALGVNWVTRWTMYVGVHFFGKWSYKGGLS